MRKYEIKNRWTNELLFAIEADSWKLAVEAAVKSSADLQGANLRGANFRDVNFRGANLLDADLQGANFLGADLQGVNFLGADLQGADFQGADLRGADLQEANLLGADFQGANLQGAIIFEGIKALRSPLQVSGLSYPVVIWDQHMQIGCEFHNLTDWQDFSNVRIIKMGNSRALRFWKAHKDTLLALAKSDGRGKTVGGGAE